MWTRKTSEQADLDDRNAADCCSSVCAYALNTPGPKNDHQVAGDVDDQIEEEERGR